MSNGGGVLLASPAVTGTPVDRNLPIWTSETDGSGGETNDAEPTTAAVGPKPTQAKRSPLRNLLEWVVVVGGALAVALVIRAFLFQTFWIPSPSMTTTLMVNDRVIVNKMSYRLHDVRRGDIVVFHRPKTDQVGTSQVNDLIKRVIGLEGERVSILDGGVRIDGKPLSEPYTHGLETIDQGCSTGEMKALFTDEGYQVPPGHVFVLGDNRVNSGDGRCFGPVDEDLIVGRAFFKIWPPGRIGGV